MSKSASQIGQTINRIKRRADKKLVQPLISPFYLDYNADYRNSIFLAGTERSGTTWVSDIINYNNEYRYIFEPFWAVRVEICRGFQSQQYLRPDNDDPYFLEVAKTILTGHIRNKWVDKYHRRFIAHKRLIKDVRANLLLKWMSINFPEMPIIFLIRHPCAVASSQIRGNHQFRSLQEEFFGQKELMADFLDPFRSEMDRAQSEFERCVFRWCIQNYVPLKQFKAGEIHITFYEHFCEKPRAEIDRLFTFLSKSYDDRVFSKLREPSSQTNATSAIISGNSLIEGWRRWVTDDQIKRTVEILSLFGLDKIYSAASMPEAEGVNHICEDSRLLDSSFFVK